MRSYADAEERIREGAIDGLNAIALVTTSYIKASIQKGPATGKVYHRYGPKRIHQASARGEYPATDTGRLVASIGFENDDVLLRPGVIIFANAAYAMPLELKPSSKGGRPFMSRAIRERQEDYGKILSAAINARLRK